MMKVKPVKGSTARKGSMGTKMPKKGGAKTANSRYAKKPMGRTKSDKPKMGPVKPKGGKGFNSGAYEKARKSHYKL